MVFFSSNAGLRTPNGAIVGDYSVGVRGETGHKPDFRPGKIPMEHHGNYRQEPLFRSS
jgi:hypothetical protein